MIKDDYLKTISDAQKLLETLHKDQDSQHREKGNLRFLLKHQILEMDQIADYIRNYGIEQG